MNTLCGTVRGATAPWMSKAPVAPAPVKAAELETVRPEVQDAIDFIMSADSIRTVATTRSAPPPVSDQGFGAQRFGVTVTKGENQLKAIFQTEGRVSHGQWITPGQTQIDGWVGLTSNLYGRPELRLSDAEVKALNQAARQQAAKTDSKSLAGEFGKMSAWTKAIYVNGDPSKSL